jgi:hypothetical protein
MTGPTKDNLARFEQALMGQQAATFELTLFVTGASDLSALSNTTRVLAALDVQAQPVPRGAVPG